MARRFWEVKLDKNAGPIRRALQYAFYDWTRDMSPSNRFATQAGMILQSLAIGFMSSSRHVWLRDASILVWLVGLLVMNGMLTLEFVRKTQLEADQIAAQQIQQTLHPDKMPDLPGYTLEAHYKPFRDVGGDYYDVIDLGDNRTLFAMADVSGKGVPAALLAANIQALVRSISLAAADLPTLAGQINRHLARYTPSDRYATALFLLLDRDSGQLSWVNAGHNAPILIDGSRTIQLEATGMPVGLFPHASYQASSIPMAPGSTLLFFTDGLTDSIPGDQPEARLSTVLADPTADTMAALRNLVDPKLNEDDVTFLLLRRAV
jgi:sigma-B regulation protein RsbU (phosphoserine phosphatase)